VRVRVRVRARARMSNDSCPPLRAAAPASRKRRTEKTDAAKTPKELVKEAEDELNKLKSDIAAKEKEVEKMSKKIPGMEKKVKELKEAAKKAAAPPAAAPAANKRMRVAAQAAQPDFVAEGKGMGFQGGDLAMYVASRKTGWETAQAAKNM
jgi:chromosome segregation ATPase